MNRTAVLAFCIPLAFATMLVAWKHHRAELPSTLHPQVVAPPAPPITKRTSSDNHGEIFGPATVIDGDTIRVNDVKIRLDGIDAPEGNQACKIGDQEYRCGDRSRMALDQLLKGKHVQCSGSGSDQYGRV